MSDSNMRTTQATYTPIDRVEDRPQWLPELAALGLAFAGFTLQSGLTGVAACGVVAALWTRLRTEFVFAGGILLLVALGGTFSSVLTLLGFVGFLAVDLARTWKSMYPVIVFFGLVVVLGASVVYATSDIAAHWVGLGTAVSMALVAYALHRYELVRFGTDAGSSGERESDTNTRGETTIQSERVTESTDGSTTETNREGE